MSRSPKKRDKEPERFYLLPGQGGKSFRQKRRIIIAWSIFAALVFSGALTGLFFLLNRTPH